MEPSRTKSSSDQVVKHVCQSLKQLAAEKGPDFKLPTTRELCARYGTNMVNVNNALRELEAQDVIYRRQGSGIYVSPNVNRTRIAVLLDYSFFVVPNASPFWGMLWGLLAQEAARRSHEMAQDASFHLMLPYEKGDAPLPETLVRAFETGQIHGVIGIGLRDNVADWLIRREIPFVAEAGHARYMVHGAPGLTIRVGVPELVKRGCRRIGLLIPSEQHRPERPSGDTRLFAELLAEHGTPFNPCLVIDNREAPEEGASWQQTLGAHGSRQQQGFDGVMKFFRGESAPDGIIITDDVMASGAIAALHELGLRLWDDVKIVSHRNVGSPMLFHYEKRMIGVAVDPSEIVAMLYALLDRALAEGVPEVDSVFLIEGHLMLPEV
jgi:DNA-binding LacI/PurR family transcriptional regulator